MATSKKVEAQSTATADVLDDEVTAGRRLVLRHSGRDFECLDLANMGGWEESASLIADVSGENGMARVAPALRKILGSEQMDIIREWSLVEVMKLSAALGERIGNAMGSAGE